MEFLKAEGFSETIIRHFFVPFFGGVCLDPQIRASSRVLLYVLRMFAGGDAAIPAQGMEQIPKQLVRDLPTEWVTTGLRVHHIRKCEIVMNDGNRMPARAIVVATEGPEASRITGSDATEASVSETCLYFSCDHATWHPPYLLLNGDGKGPINNIAFPSRISAAYAPGGKSLVSVVVLGNPDGDDSLLLNRVRTQLMEWFGTETRRWTHLHTRPS
jgi:protoporphyrinogen oxidase